MAHYHRRVWVCSVWKGSSRVTFPPPKVCMIRTEPHWAVLVSQYPSVGVGLLRRLKGCRQVRATHAVCWLVDRIATSVRQGDNNTLPSKYFCTTAKASFIEENVAQKFVVLLGSSTLLLFVHCAHYFFFLQRISFLHRWAFDGESVVNNNDLFFKCAMRQSGRFLRAEKIPTCFRSSSYSPPSFLFLSPPSSSLTLLLLPFLLLSSFFLLPPPLLCFWKEQYNIIDNSYCKTGCVSHCKNGGGSLVPVGWWRNVGYQGDVL